MNRTTYTLTRSQLAESLQKTWLPLIPTHPQADLLRRNRLKAWGSLASVIVGCVITIAGCAWGAIQGVLIFAAAGIPAAFVLQRILQAIFRSRHVIQQQVDLSIAGSPQLLQPCTFEITPDTLRFAHPCIEQIISPGAIISHEELPSIVRICSIESTHLIDLAALQRDGLLEPLRAWLSRNVATK